MVYNFHFQTAKMDKKMMWLDRRHALFTLGWPFWTTLVVTDLCHHNTIAYNEQKQLTFLSQARCKC